MKRKWVVWAVSLIVTLFLPITLFGLMLSVNEYEDHGISSAVDCDGPLSIMIFILPSLVVYAAGFIYYAVLIRGRRQSLLAAVLMVLCAVMVFAAARKAWMAYSEKNRPQYRETCGEGW
jgi:uncharacterized BrkB/YihY/UPF0761 family membrane protein